MYLEGATKPTQTAEWEFAVSLQLTFNRQIMHSEFPTILKDERTIQCILTTFNTKQITFEYN